MGKAEAVVPKLKGKKASVPGAQGARESDEADEIREAVEVKILRFIGSKMGIPCSNVSGKFTSSYCSLCTELVAKGQVWA